MIKQFNTKQCESKQKDGEEEGEKEDFLIVNLCQDKRSYTFHFINLLSVDLSFIHLYYLDETKPKPSSHETHCYSSTDTVSALIHQMKIMPKSKLIFAL